MRVSSPRTQNWRRSLPVTILYAITSVSWGAQPIHPAATTASDRAALNADNNTTVVSQASDREASVDISYMSKHPPVYPIDGEERAVGIVVLQVLVGADGSIREVKVERSTAPRALEASAVAAANTWRYNPKIQHGKPVDAWVRIPVEFKL
jgi:TonB family protein